MRSPAILKVAVLYVLEAREATESPEVSGIGFFNLSGALIAQSRRT